MKDDTISRAAAISHVDDVPYIKDHPNVGLLWKAWIESLPSAQPVAKDINVSVKDCISRQAAIDAFKKELTVGESKGNYVTICSAIGYEGAKRILESLPSAQTGRQKGKWLPDNNNYYEERFICSVCGKSYKVDTCMGKPMWNFCPCGADMMEDGDGKCAED